MGEAGRVFQGSFPLIPPAFHSACALMAQDGACINYPITLLLNLLLTLFGLIFSLFSPEPHHSQEKRAHH